MKDAESKTKSYSDTAMLTTKQAAEYIGVSSNMLRLARHKGELYKGAGTPTFIKPGNSSVRYFRRDLDSFLESLPRCSSTADANSRGLCKSRSKKTNNLIEKMISNGGDK